MSVVAPCVVSEMKHLNLSPPRVANLGSASCIIVIQPRVGVVPPRPVPTSLVGKMLSSVVSMRQLFHVNGSQPPGPLCVPFDTSPGSAMYVPQNPPSPDAAGMAWLVGNFSSTPVVT